MSRVGKLPIAVPSSVKVDLSEKEIVVKGGNNELRLTLTGDVQVSLDEGQVWVKPANDSKQSRAMWGTVRACINNMVTGVSAGFKRELEIRGVGYRAAVQGNILSITLGFSHEVRYVIPAGVSITIEKQTLLTVTGHDKQRVGQVAAEIRALRKPEPYKGKGVRYVGERAEFVRMKEGKKK